MSDDFEILDEESQRVNMWDATDSRILRSVHAYLVWHSGAGFRESISSNNERSMYLDGIGEEAVSHAEHGYDMSDDRRIRSLVSLDTQTQHEPGDSPVCYLDIQLIENGLFFLLQNHLTFP